MFSEVHRESRGCNGPRLQHEKFWLNIKTKQKKKRKSLRVVKHWNRLFKKAVKPPVLVMFKPRLCMALNNIV